MRITVTGIPEPGIPPEDTGRREPCPRSQYAVRLGAATVRPLRVILPATARELAALLLLLDHLRGRPASSSIPKSSASPDSRMLFARNGGHELAATIASAASVSATPDGNTGRKPSVR